MFIVMLTYVKEFDSSQNGARDVDGKNEYKYEARPLVHGHLKASANTSYTYRNI